MSDNNRLHNAKNPYQGDELKVLCVCSAGLLRSPTAANVLHREYGFNTRAAGISPDFGLIVVDGVLLEWADEVVCMNSSQEAMIKHMGFTGPVWNLDIPDLYSWMDEELQRLILEAWEAR